MIAGYDGLAAPVDASQVGIARNVDATRVGQNDGQNFGQIFDGEIRFTITGRDNPTDTYILIQAIDGHQAFVAAKVNTTLAAGYKVADLHAATMQSFQPFGVTQGITDSDAGYRIPPRARDVWHGAGRNEQRCRPVQCQLADCGWPGADGQH